MARQLSKRERAAIAAGAEEAAAQVDAVELLTRDELMQMSLEEIDLYFRQHGVFIDWELIGNQVRGSMSDDVVMLNRGQALEESRAERLKESVKKATVKAARAIANQSLNDMRQAAFDEADDRAEDERWYMWVSVGEGACDSCLSRHGTIFQRDMWDGIEPRSGTTLCGLNCRCTLVPVASPGRANEGVRIEEAREGLPALRQ